MPVEPGQTLSHYRVISKIGAGGMGEVYLAEDTKLQRQVALKILPAAMSSDPDRLSRFTREARAIAALNHPNIVTIHSVEEAGEIRFLAMEHVEGSALDQMIQPGGLPLRQLMEIAVPLADALSAAHDKGITHRDLKPANVMVSDQGRVKMLDFGLAKHMDRSPGDEVSRLATEAVTREGVVMGTLPYMSPEQAEGKPVDHRSDIFSLGIVLHEMACGRKPFSGETPARLLSSILRDSPQPLTQIREDLPPDLARIVGRCLEKIPLDRFQTARDVYNELRALRRQIDSGEISSVSQVGSASSAGVAMPRGGRSRLVLGAAAAAVLIAAGVWWFARGPAGTQRGEAGQAPPARAAATPGSDRTMLVVLPFENLGPAEDEYFAAGMADEITSRLASVSGLGVISRKSAMSYAGTDKTIRQIGDELGVGYVLEGTIRWAAAGDAGASRVRITPQLIRVGDDTQVWSGTYDRVLEDVFDIQAEIAAEVAGQLGISLLEPERRALERRPTDDVAAYQDFLRGRDHSRRYDQDGLELAIQLFGQALERDPEFLEAWALLARAHSAIIHFGLDLSEQRDRLAREAADKALALDPESPEAHVAMGFYHYHGRKDYEAALAEFRTADSLRPDDTDTLLGLALVLRRQGRWEESTRHLERAVRLNPRDEQTLIDLGDNYLETGRYAESEIQLRKALEIRPDLPWASYYLVLCLWLGRGDLAGARQVLEAAPTTDMEAGTYMWYWQHLYEGDPAGALAVLDGSNLEQFRLGATRIPATVYRGLALRLMGDEDGARRAFEEARRTLEAEIAAGGERTRLPRAPLGIAYAALGRGDEGIREGRLALELFPLSKDAVWGDQLVMAMAWIYVLAGDHDSALDQLELLGGIAQQEISAPLLRIDPRWAPLRSHPRLEALMEKFEQREKIDR